MDRDSAARVARQSLLIKERATAAAIIREYSALINRLEKEIEFLTGQIAVAQDSGERSVNFLIERNRLKTILDAVSVEMTTTADQLARLTTGAQKFAIATAQNQIEQTGELSAYKFPFDAEATAQIAGQSALGSPLETYFQKLDAPLRQAFFQILTYGVATGRPSPQIAAELKNTIKISASRAMTISRTETNRAYRDASLIFYQSAGVKKWRWVSALDLNTCPVCWALHGKIFNTKTPFGSHPNCRCTMTVVLPKDKPAETGADRFAALSGAQQKTIIGGARFDLYQRGAKLADFVQTQKTPFGTSRTLKRLDDVNFKGTARKPKPVPITKPKPSAPPIKKAAPVQDFNFKTTTDAESWATARFPGVVFDFSKARPELVNPTLKEFDRLATEFPEVAARVKYVGTYKTKPVPYRENLTIDPQNKKDVFRKWIRFKGEFAHASTDGRRIGLNPSFYGNPAKMKESLDRSFSGGWLASNKVESVLTHEFGHQVDNWIKSQTMKTAGEFMRASGDNTISNLLSVLRKKYKPTANLSRYSLTNQSEAFAEAFSSRTHTDPAKQDDFVKRLDKFLNALRRVRIYDAAPVGTQPGANNWKDFRDAPDKTAALEKLKADLKEFGLDYDEDF